MNRRSLFMAPLAALLAPEGAITVPMTARMALGLKRSLEDGRPMAGPDVEPLIGRLSAALGVEEPAPAAYGPPAPTTTY